MITRLTLVVLLLSLTACVGPPVIAMKNPATGEIRECKTGQVSALYEIRPATDCANALMRDGWRIY